jgi:hypothetical protein
MEYWLRRGDAEYSFDAPEEASIYEAQPGFKTVEDINDKLAKMEELLSSRLIIIDYGHPLEPYINLLKGRVPQDALLILTCWRLGDERREAKILREIKSRLPNLNIYSASQLNNPSEELRRRLSEFIKKEGEAICIYPMTPITDLASPVLESLASGILAWRGDMEQSDYLEVKFVGIAHDPRGALIDVTPGKIGCHAAYNVELKDQFDCVVVSPGGAPYDDSFYQSSQSLYGVYQSVKKGGTIILTAECVEGIGSREFAKLLSARRKSGAGREAIGPKTTFEGILLDFFERVKEKSRIYLVSPIPRTIAQSFLDIKVFDALQDAVQQAIRLHSRSLSMCVVPYGNFTRLVVEKEASPEEQRM